MISPVWLSLLFFNIHVGGLTYDQSLKRYESEQRHMGVRVRVVLYAEDVRTAKQAFDAAFARIRQLDRRLSDYRDDSEVNQLCRQAKVHTPVEISHDLWNCLEKALEISRQSEGAFDVTVGPLTQLWRRARRQRRLPAEEILDQAKKRTSYRWVRLRKTDRSIVLTKEGMRLDFGGIAKGYAADQALHALSEKGIRRALVDVGGDLALGDPPPQRTGWRVGVARLDAQAGFDRLIEVANCGVATSGDVWQFVEISGKRYSHIVDPKTGIGLTQRGQVTVIAGNATAADAWASAISVMGVRRGIAMAEETTSIESLFVYLDDDKPRMSQTSGFPQEIDP